MTTKTKCVALGVLTAFAVGSWSVFAQDDLDNLLKDLESENKTTAKTEVKAEEPKAEAEVKAEEPKGEEKTEEPKVEAEVKAEEPKAEEKVEEAKAEEKTEEAKPEEKVEEKVAEAKTEEKVEEKAETEEAKTEEKAEETKTEEKVAETKTEEVKTEEPKAEEKTEEAKVEEKPAPKAVSPDAELLANVTATERLRRLSLDAQAKREIAEARQAMSDEEYDQAVEHYFAAARLLNDRPAMKKLRRECEQGIAEGLYREALQAHGLGRFTLAQDKMEKAVNMGHPKARRLLEKWRASGEKVEEKQDLSEIKHVQNEEDYKLEREQIRKHLRRGRQYLAVRDMKHALEEVEIVLVNDPYNQEAIRLRKAIQKKRQTILLQEREAARDGMIADVDEAWRPAYAVNAARLNEKASETVKVATGEDPERTQEQEIENRMKAMRLPTISFKPPATIMDAVEFFRQASVDYDRPDIPAEKRGFNFVLKTPQPLKMAAATEDEGGSNDFASNGGDEGGESPSNGLSAIPTITASDITFYEALKLVCDSVDYKFIVRGPVVMVMHKDMSTAEIISSKYNVPESFMERVTTASDEMKQMGGFGSGSNKKAAADESEESPDRDWKAFFEEMGVKWPEGSSIKHIKSLGKLYVRNTRENLAEFEKVLDELGGQPQLIEIETRFVEVSQQDLNSLGFEWILNSDYSLNLGDQLGRALGLKEGAWGTDTSSSSTTSSQANELINGWNNSSSSSSSGGYASGTTYVNPSSSSWSNQGYGTEIGKNTTTTSYSASDTVVTGGAGGSWRQYSDGTRGLGVNAFGGTSDYSNGNRYLSTVGNHISGESASTNDQFMRVNAFLGQADLSMILHMLSQRSDTDLLSAPKVVTKSGENAVIKVVTEYIYPQDYDVQLQSSSSGSSSSSSGGSQSAILAVVEPQNFTMREVGVILDVTPTYSEANGGTIDLELKPQVVDEPTWKNYGMKIPFTGNSSSLQSFDGIGSIFEGLSTALDSINATLDDATRKAMALAVTDTANESLRSLSTSSSENMTYYDAPMEQPFFHVRSIDSKVSITPGSTVVMGGLITESRKAMDDKIPFLGDLPFIGRLFRSHSEQTIKRNLLIFVTGRLITPSGRELRLNEEEESSEQVKPAPKAD